jgi:hypothetical protein
LTADRRAKKGGVKSSFGHFPKPNALKSTHAAGEQGKVLG